MNQGQQVATNRGPLVPLDPAVVEAVFGIIEQCRFALNSAGMALNTIVKLISASDNIQNMAQQQTQQRQEDENPRFAPFLTKDQEGFLDQMMDMAWKRHQADQERDLAAAGMSAPEAQAPEDLKGRAQQQ